MKKILLLAALTGLSAVCLADSVTDIQSTANYDLKFTTATWIVNQNGAVTTGLMAPGSSAQINKPAGSLNGSCQSFSELYASLGIYAPANFTGTNLGSNRLKIGITAPTLIGHPLTLYINNKTYALSNVSSFSGTVTVDASRLSKPLLDVFTNNARNTTLESDPTPGSVSLQGTYAGKPFTLTLSSVLAGGLGGQTVANFVDMVELFSGPVSGQNQIFADTVQGGQNATVTVTLHQPAAVATHVAMSYSGTGFSGPPTITVPAGALKGTGIMTTSATNTFNFITFRGTLGGYFEKSSVCDIAPMLSYFTFSGVGSTGPNRMPGGGSVTITVNTLTPVSGTTVVQLYSTNANVPVPATVTILAGHKSGSVTVKTPFAPSGDEVQLYGFFPNQLLFASGGFVLMP